MKSATKWVTDCLKPSGELWCAIPTDAFYHSQTHGYIENILYFTDMYRYWAFRYPYYCSHASELMYYLSNENGSCETMKSLLNCFALWRAIRLADKGHNFIYHNHYTCIFMTLGHSYMTHNKVSSDLPRRDISLAGSKWPHLHCLAPGHELSFTNKPLFSRNCYKLRYIRTKVVAFSYTEESIPVPLYGRDSYYIGQAHPADTHFYGLVIRSGKN
jgi:hypothetical protein